MANISINKDLTQFNTLSIPSVASSFVELAALSQIDELVRYSEEQSVDIRVLGGGSNLVLPNRLNKLVVKVELKGKEILEEDERGLLLQVSAGENWHSLVTWAVNSGYCGIENLALIPGSVGASPVQNIGAYGVEIKDCLDSLIAYDIENKCFRTFSNEECQFSYRHSYFKTFENKFIITSVNLKLSKQLQPNLNYGPLKKLALHENLIVKDIYDLVCKIRLEKLPDPLVVPNAGSFFKNPIVNKKVHSNLAHKYPDLVSYPYEDQFKLAAGWLIDQTGLKGRSNAYGVGCYKYQALVLVNPEGADSNAVTEWADYVVQKVEEMFSVTLEPEPRYWT